MKDAHMRCVCVCARACVRVHVRACVCVCARECVCVWETRTVCSSELAQTGPPLTHSRRFFPFFSAHNLSKLSACSDQPCSCFYSVCLNGFLSISSIPYMKVSKCVRCPAPNPGKSVQDPGCCTEGILNMLQHHSYSNMPFISSSDWFEAQQVWGNTAAVSLHVVYGKTRPNRNSYAIWFALNKFIKEAEKERGGKKAQLGERDLGNLQRVHALHTESFQPTSVCLVIYFKWAHIQSMNSKCE